MINYWREIYLFRNLLLHSPPRLISMKWGHYTYWWIYIWALGELRANRQNKYIILSINSHPTHLFLGPFFDQNGPNISFLYGWTKILKIPKMEGSASRYFFTSRSTFFSLADFGPAKKSLNRSLLLNSISIDFISKSDSSLMKLWIWWTM